MMKKNDTSIDLIVADNGVGLPDSVDLENIDSLGLRLVSILIKDQLQGNLEVINENGVMFKLSFPVY